MSLLLKRLKFLRSHFAAASWNGRGYFHYVFTQENTAMFSSVLNSERSGIIILAVRLVVPSIKEDR